MHVGGPLLHHSHPGASQGNTCADSVAVVVGALGCPLPFYTKYAASTLNQFI